MAEAAQTGFRRDLTPIENVFRKSSPPEMDTPDIATDDERSDVPLSATVGTLDFDVHQCIDICREHYEKAGTGADDIDTLLR
jgi:hypothetical protein